MTPELQMDFGRRLPSMHGELLWYLHAKPCYSANPRLGSEFVVTTLFRSSQLETHRHPLPLPEELMRNLGGGHWLTKTDLTDAHNQSSFARKVVIVPVCPNKPVIFGPRSLSKRN